jgi:hypothetical protein
VLENLRAGSALEHRTAGKVGLCVSREVHVSGDVYAWGREEIGGWALAVIVEGVLRADQMSAHNQSRRSHDRNTEHRVASWD